MRHGLVASRLRMGQQLSRTRHSATERQNAFKLFEYQCPNCSARRPIQYFYRNGVFLPQRPRVVCGECRTSVMVEPFKTVEYSCPTCKKWQKARLPARSVPLNLYNVSVVSCNCGFRGEVAVGRLMDVACGHCWARKRELRDIWAEDGDEVRTFCSGCQDYQRSFARVPQKKAAERASDLEYTCENCHHVRPVHVEELLRSEGLVACSLCSWIGYPEVVPRGEARQPGQLGPPGQPGQATGGAARLVEPPAAAVAAPPPRAVNPGA